MPYRVALIVGMMGCLVISGLRAEGQSADLTRPIHCLVSLIDDVNVPAQQTGVLVKIDVKPGQQVTKGDVLARLDDGQAQMQRKIAVAEQQVAQEKASNDASIRAAEAARSVAEAEYQLNLEANARVPGTKPAIEMQRLQLVVEQATRQIQQSQHEQKVAELQVGGMAAKVEMAEDEIARRRIVAPIDGEVVEVMVRAGEWVEPGNPVFRVVRLDRLRIEGFLNTSHIAPSEVRDRDVQVTVKLVQGRSETFTGRIVFVNPLVQAGGEYRIWAEVDNRRDNGSWLLQPGYEVEMTLGNRSLAGRGLPALQ